MEDNGQADTPTAKGNNRYKKSLSSLSISALFHGHLHRRHEPAAATAAAEPSSPEPPPSSTSSSPKANHSRWIWHRHHNDHHHHHNHNQNQNYAGPEIKGKCRNLISNRKGHHRRHTSDLTYDPLSYSQNFERDDGDGDDNDFPWRNTFTARLRAAEKGEEMENPPSKEGKKITRRKSFDLNDLMNVAKILEDGQPIQNQENNDNLQT
nr:hypothetical protein DM860_000613 [Ipomoea batatas]